MASTATGHGPSSAGDFEIYRHRHDRLDLTVMPLNVRHIEDVIRDEDNCRARNLPDKFEGPVCVDGSFIVKHNYNTTLAGNIWINQKLSASTNTLEHRGKVTVSASADLLNSKWQSEEISVGPTGEVVYGCLILQGKGMIKARNTYVRRLLHNYADADYAIGGTVIVDGNVKVAHGSVLRVDDLVVLGDLHVHSNALLIAHKVTVRGTAIVDTGGQFAADEMNGCGRIRINLEK
ncbi:hypothetical protein DL771_008913 [Monosporascus sp. 5C6A]|nr:hypothetical protein DL771_008913 [Monosporascus sp. 5C6A]